MSSTSISPLLSLATVAVVSLVSGFFIGQLWLPDQDESDDYDAPDDAFADSTEECKMVLVVRTDLGMSPGKIAAQCGHAAVGCYESVEKSNPRLLQQWRNGGQAKIVLQCKSEQEMTGLQRIAKMHNITSRIIHDAGRTEIASGTATVIGIGPAPKSEVDKVTGHLRLYR